MGIEASYDVLFISNKLSIPLQGISEGEIQRTCYLSCLLGLYAQKPIAEWGYSFIQSELSTPYSHDVSSSIQELIQSAQLTILDGLINITSEGTDTFHSLACLEYLSERALFLEASCNSVLALPAATISTALENEPSMLSASAHTESTQLLQAGAQRLIYQQFEALSEVIGTEALDLMIPSIVWLSYLSDKETANAGN